MGVNQNRIRAFDGLRGVAVVAVILSHKLDIQAIFGRMGVWLFFVLSGFLIVRILARGRDRIEAGANALDVAGGFFWRRAARLLPIYYLTLALFTLAGFLGAAQPIAVGEHPFFWFHGVNLLIEARNEWTVLSHFWSLGVEEQFYLLAAPLLLLCPRRRMLMACWAIVLVGLCARLWLWQAGASALLLYIDAPTNFAILAFGGVLGLLADRPLPAALRSGGAQALILTVYSTAVFWLAFAGADVVAFGSLTAVFAGLLLVQVYQGQNTWFVQALDSAPFRQVGVISYGLYLFHPLIRLRGVLGDSALTPLVEIALAFAAAALSWRFIEAPIRDWAARPRAPALGAQPIAA